MISQISKSIFISIGIGFIVEILNSWLSTPFLHKFLESNLITLLVALLAINGATMGIVLTKIRDLIDKDGGADCFKSTRRQMLLSIKEQIGLIIFATILLSLKSSPQLSSLDNLELLMNSCIIATFVYALNILYDVTKGVLIIVDYEN